MLTVRVKVSKLVYQFVVALYGSSTIICSNNDTITNKVKCILSQIPSGYTLPRLEADQYYIDIEVKRINIGRIRYGNGKSYSVIQKRADANTFINEAMQKELNIELKNLFKDMFCNYILAFCRGRKFEYGCQHDAIYDFCSVYNIDLDRIDYDALKKAWQRSKQYSEFISIRPAFRTQSVPKKIVYETN